MILWPIMDVQTLSAVSWPIMNVWVLSVVSWPIMSYKVLGPIQFHVICLAKDHSSNESCEIRPTSQFMKRVVCFEKSIN